MHGRDFRESLDEGLVYGLGKGSEGKAGCGGGSCQAVGACGRGHMFLGCGVSKFKSVVLEMRSATGDSGLWWRSTGFVLGAGGALLCMG